MSCPVRLKNLCNKLPDRNREKKPMVIQTGVIMLI